MPDQPSRPVVVTSREVERIFSGKEAVGGLEEAAKSDATVSDEQRAAILAGVGHVLREIRKAEDKAGAMVLTTPQVGPASRLQSLIASGEAAKLSGAPSGRRVMPPTLRDWRSDTPTWAQETRGRQAWYPEELRRRIFRTPGS